MSRGRVVAPRLSQMGTDDKVGGLVENKSPFRFNGGGLFLCHRIEGRRRSVGGSRS
jgi:hypothetical protein